MRALLAMVRCSHPGPTAAVTSFTTALAIAAGAGGRAAWVAAAVLAGQLSVGWSNDWLDRDRDRATQRHDKPLVQGDVADVTVARGAVAAAVACAVLSAPLGAQSLMVHLTAVAAAWAYNLALKSTAFSPVPYSVAFGLLPVFVTLSLPEPTLPPVWAVVTGALLGAGAHFANTLPDLADDARTGVRGLPHRLGEGSSLAAATVLLGAGGLTVATGPQSLSPAAWAALVATALTVVAVPVSWIAGRQRAAFTLAIAAAAGVVVTLLVSGSRLT